MNEDKLCAADAGAAPRAGEGRSCVPGCSCPHTGPPADPNAPPTCYEGRPPSELAQVLREHLRDAPMTNMYNEVVVDTASVVGGLPHSVAAFFYRTSSGEEQREEVKRAHASFLREYGLGDGGVHGKAVPLLELDLGGSDRPLRLVRP